MLNPTATNYYRTLNQAHTPPITSTCHYMYAHVPLIPLLPLPLSPVPYPYPYPYPPQVVRTALTDASGVASLMTTTEAMVVDAVEEKKE